MCANETESRVCGRAWGSAGLATGAPDGPTRPLRVRRWRLTGSCREGAPPSPAGDGRLPKPPDFTCPCAHPRPRPSRPLSLVFGSSFQVNRVSAANTQPRMCQSHGAVLATCPRGTARAMGPLGVCSRSHTETVHRVARGPNVIATMLLSRLLHDQCPNSTDISAVPTALGKASK